MSSGTLVKDLKNGNSFCQICSMQFKTKTLTAHLNGRKHREALLQLKQKDTTTQLKRAKEEASTGGENNKINAEIGLKRRHPQKDDFVDGENGKRIRKDADVEERRTTVPWQAEVQKNEKAEAAAAERNTGINIIEGLPKGFFDDEQLNSRVRETVEKQRQITTEIDKFYKEVEELDIQKEDEHEELNEQTAIRSDIEMIDEQIERWKRVNELEKQKETLVDAVTSKFEQQQKPNFDPMEMPDDSGDGDDDSIDFDKITWRTKAF